MTRMPVGVDLGSSSVKAMRVAGSGRPGRAARRRIATRRLSGGRVEHDGEEILSAALAALRQAALPQRSDDRDLGIATQRSTVLFWDRRTGRPLTPAYSWQDLRGASLIAALLRSGRVDKGLFAGTGLRLTPYYSASKLLWALRSVRGLRRRVASGRALWGTLGTFLLWRLGGGVHYAIDHANAQRTLLFDLETLSWDPALFEAFDLAALLDAPALPALLPTSLATPLPLAGSGRPLRLRAMTGDQQAAQIGLGCRSEGVTTINYGSGAFVLVNTGGRCVRVPGLLTTLLSSRPAGRGSARPVTQYALEGPVNAAATAIDWGIRKLRLRLRLRTRDLDRYLGVEAGRPRAVHFLPAVAGVGAPRWDASARPRFAGDVRAASSRDLLRAVVESIALRCAEIIRVAEAHTAPGAGNAPNGGEDRPRPVLVAGGLTRCRTLLQAQADLLQRPVVVRESPDATCLGAALLTRGHASRWSGERTTIGARRGGGVTRPRISPDEAENRYRDWERAVYGEEPVSRRDVSGAEASR
jgi:glycerol kinase